MPGMGQHGMACLVRGIACARHSRHGMSWHVMACHGMAWQGMCEVQQAWQDAMAWHGTSSCLLYCRCGSVATDRSMFICPFPSSSDLPCHGLMQDAGQQQGADFRRGLQQRSGEVSQIWLLPLLQQALFHVLHHSRAKKPACPPPLPHIALPCCTTAPAQVSKTLGFVLRLFSGGHLRIDVHQVRSSGHGLGFIALAALSSCNVSRRARG